MTITYLLTSKQPHVPVSAKFNLYFNHIEIKRSDSVKYLDVWIDETLSWSAHIRELSLQSAKCCTMEYWYIILGILVYYLK